MQEWLVTMSLRGGDRSEVTESETVVCANPAMILEVKKERVLDMEMQA